jgi:hypothetical protein
LTALKEARVTGKIGADEQAEIYFARKLVFHDEGNVLAADERSVKLATIVQPADVIWGR